MKPQLLVVDDETEISDLLRRHFGYLGYEVTTADNGVRALRVLESKRMDIVISDIRMPGMNGIDLLESIRSEYPMIRVIMITGYVTQENILACMRLGAEACIFKPLEDLEELEGVVANTWKQIQRWWRVLAELGTQSHQRVS